jgi:MFS family permease
MWDYTATSVYYQVLAGPAFIITFALFSMPMGFIATVPVVRRSTLLSLCAIMWSIIVGITGFTSMYWQILLARIALGIFQAACTPFAGSIITDVFSEVYTL